MSDVYSDKRLSKDEARALAYQGLHQAKAARFPFPIEGRIPNFVGAEAAARRLATLPVYQNARGLKVNPDAPQLPVRAMALADGKTLYMPSPRLRGKFIRIVPGDVPPGEQRRAASLSHCHRYGKELDLTELTQSLLGDYPIDLVITGSVAATRRGARAGKGEGYSDMEYALLRELGVAPVPVVTTVHTAQIVSDMEVDPHDLSVDVIVTPEEVIDTQTPLPKPSRILWDQLTEGDLVAMPIFAELQTLLPTTQAVPDIIAPHLDILFVGVNPGQKSAAEGHNFSGPGNHFWRLLFESGLTPRLLTPQEEHLLLDFRLGITNVVARPTRGEADLSWDELVAGGRVLRDKVEQYRPRMVALLGKNVYRAYAGLRRSAPVDWGVQPRSVVQGVTEFVAPNPSARSTIPYAKRLKLFTDLRGQSLG